MSDSTRQWWSSVADLGGAVGLAGLTTTLAVVDVPVLRVVFGLVSVLFVPGYVFVSTLYPADGEAIPDTRGWCPSTPARVRLSFAMSLVVVPLLGLVVSLFVGQLSPMTLVTAQMVAVLVGAVVAALRRFRRPAESRYRPIRCQRMELPAVDCTLDTVLTAVLAVSVVLALSGLCFALAVPGDGEQYTEFSLRTESGSELVTSGFPREVATGESIELVTVVENREHRQTTYTVVVEQERMTNGSVVEKRELDRFQATVGDGETWWNDHEIAPTPTGPSLRLNYSLYRGRPSVDETSETPYRSLVLWLNLSASEN